METLEETPLVPQFAFDKYIDDSRFSKAIIRVLIPAEDPDKAHFRAKLVIPMAFNDGETINAFRERALTTARSLLNTDPVIPLLRRS